MIQELGAMDQRTSDFFSNLLAYGNERAAPRSFAEYDEVFGEELSVPIIYEPQ